MSFRKVVLGKHIFVYLSRRRNLRSDSYEVGHMDFNYFKGVGDRKFMWVEVKKVVIFLSPKSLKI